MITLKQWAAQNGLHDSHARRLAIAGRLETAKKIGRDWMVSEKQEYRKMKPGRKADPRRKK